MKQILLKIAITIAAIFAPVQSIMVSAFIMILCDLLSGVIASKKRGEKIVSAGFQRTIVKILVYEVAIALGFIAQHYLMADALPICNIIGSYIGLTELLSAYENLNDIAGGDLLKNIIKKLGSSNK